MSWLAYTDPTQIQVVLQDDQHVVDANHGTGVLTSLKPPRVRKTRLAETALEQGGFDVVDRRLDHTSRARPEDYHVALLGVDSVEPRQLITGANWNLAIDAGLGTGPADFNAILLRRFPALVPSDQVIAWKSDVPGNGVPTRQRSPTSSDATRADPPSSPEPPSAPPSSESSRPPRRSPRPPVPR